MIKQAEVACFVLSLFSFASLLLPVHIQAMRRPKDERENECLRIAIEFYNVSTSFEERMILSTKVEYFDDILDKEGVEVRASMEALQIRINSFLAVIDSWGGVRPKTDNSTNAIDEFSEEMYHEYNINGIKSHDLAQKLLKAHNSLVAAKKELIKETKLFATLRKKFLECKPRLDAVGIYLSNPKDNKDLLEDPALFDIKVLLDLKKIYDSISKIEEELTPLMEGYASFDAIPSESTKLVVLASMGKVEDLEEKKNAIVIQNDKMLRQYEKLLNIAVNKARERIDEMAESFKQKENVVVDMADEQIAIDRRIRASVKKYNKLLDEANEAATEAMKLKMKTEYDRDEL